MMWNGVAKEFQDAVDVVPGPYEYDKEIKVGVVGLSYSKKLDKVDKLLKFAEAHGKAVFEEYGYVK
jgi:phage I-like protein